MLLSLLLSSNIYSIFQELFVFLRNVSIGHDTKDSSNALSQHALEFLKKNIQVNPEIMCWVLNKLISVVLETSRDIADNLKDIYFSTLRLCIERIPVRKEWYSSHEVLESHSLEANSTTNGNHLQTVLCLLSQMDVDVDAEFEFLKTAYPIISKACNVKDIELALYSRRTGRLFDKWLSLWSETHACSKSATTLDLVYKISENIFKLIENSKVVLCKQELLERLSTRKLHWLNDILVNILF